MPLLCSAFGFAAAILEGLPIIGLVFSVSNRIGAAMWAHGRHNSTSIPAFIDLVLDLEKRQHYIAEQKAQKAR